MAHSQGTLGQLIDAAQPARALPRWVTRHVVRAGSATGMPLSTGSLDVDELVLAERLGVAPERRAIHAALLSPEGLDELTAVLDAGTYAVHVPEDAALLTVAWLMRNGEQVKAEELVRALAPVAHLLRLAPRVTATRIPAAGLVSRVSAGEAAQLLHGYRARTRQQAQHEALTVWNPFTDRAVALLLETHAKGSLGRGITGEWRRRARALLVDYDTLAATHTLCSAHRRRGRGLSILIAGLRAGAAPRGRIGAARAARLVRVIAAITERRGAPGSAELEVRRDADLRAATHVDRARLARTAARRLAALPSHDGVTDVAAAIAPVTEEESRAHGIPAGTPMPPVVRHVVSRAASSTPEDLVASGVIASGDVLADLVPQLAAAAAFEGADPCLAELTAATHRAHHRHTSTLQAPLRDRSTFVSLPWIAAVAEHAPGTPEERSEALVRRIGALAVEAAPHRPVPDRLVRAVADVAPGTRLARDLHPDTFLGGFPETHRAAARATGRVLGATAYGTHFALDPAVIAGLKGERLLPWRMPWERHHRMSTLVAERSDGGRVGSSRAANLAALEAAEVLTSGNVATLVELDITPPGGWLGAARRAFEACARERPERAARAWRHTVAYVALCCEAEQAGFLEWARKVAADHGTDNEARLDALLSGLEHAVTP